MEKLVFPEWFPDGCPPDDAKSIEINLYRASSIPIEYNDDWKSYYEQGKLGDIKCAQGYGLSCITEARDADNLLKLSNFRGKHIVEGIITPESGVVKSTPNMKNASHCTWWVAKSVDPTIYFKERS